MTELQSCRKNFQFPINKTSEVTSASLAQVMQITACQNICCATRVPERMLRESHAVMYNGWIILRCLCVCVAETCKSHHPFQAAFVVSVCPFIYYYSFLLYKIKTGISLSVPKSSRGKEGLNPLQTRIMMICCL